MAETISYVFFYECDRPCVKGIKTDHGSSQSGEENDGKCCGKECTKTMIDTWTVTGTDEGDPPPHMVDTSKVSSQDNCKCTKWQLISRRENPGAESYTPRIVSAGHILEDEDSGDPPTKCKLDGLTNPVPFPLHGKQYTAQLELWIMCDSETACVKDGQNCGGDV